MPVRVNEQEFAERWGSALKNSTEKIVAGVNRVTESPTAKAADNLNKALTNYTKAITSGKTARKLRAVTLEAWKKATAEKSPQRISAGVDGAMDKMQAFGSKLIPYLNNLQEQLKSKPSVTLEDNIARMVFHARAMAQFDPSK